MLPSVLLAICLAGCGTFANHQPPPAPPPDAPILPAVPADVLACVKRPVTPPDRELDAGEVERLWKTDRAALAKVNSCLHRLICQSQDARQGIGKTEGATCEKPAAAKTKTGARRGLLRKKPAGTT